jgi:hypothetical protein
LCAVVLVSNLDLINDSPDEGLRGFPQSLQENFRPQLLLSKKKWNSAIIKPFAAMQLRY